MNIKISYTRLAKLLTTPHWSERKVDISLLEKFPVLDDSSLSKHSCLCKKYLHRLGVYLTSIYPKLYFYSIRSTKISDYLSASTNKANILLEVEEHGKLGVYHIHAISSVQLKEVRWSPEEEQEIVNINQVLLYMQKEQNNQLIWSRLGIDKSKEQEFLFSSKKELQRELEESWKLQYDVNAFEYFESLSQEISPPYHVTEQQKMNYLLVKHLVYLTNNIYPDVSIHLNSLINNPHSKRTNSSDILYMLEVLKYLHQTLEKKLVFNIMSIIVFEVGLSKKSINDLLISIGKLVKTYYVSEDMIPNFNSRVELLVANKLYDCIESILVDKKKTYIVRLINENKNAILERSDNKIASETTLSNEFKHLLQLTNEVLENKSLFLKPLDIDLKLNQIGLHFSNWKHSIYKDTVLEIKDSMCKVLTYCQQQRWSIINSFYDFIFSNKIMLFNLIKLEYKNIKEVKKPNFDAFKRSTIFNLNNLK